MSSQTPRTRERSVKIVQPPTKELATGNTVGVGATNSIGTARDILWLSEGHPVNRKTGKRESGGPFHVTHSGDFIDAGHVSGICAPGFVKPREYSGPVFGTFVPVTSIGEHFSGTPTEDMNESSMNSDGATAISQVAPTNPTASLGTGLAEMYREGFPSLPGIQSWKHRTEILRNAGSEYLNYQFGWAPLHSEIQDVVNAARHHRDIMKNYRHNEGRNVHRRFDFSSENQRWEAEIASADPITGILSSQWVGSGTPAVRKTVVEKQRHRWFEGCFTYGGPGKADNFRRHLGFGEEADAVYGLKLTPDVLWELVPWSWAVDWFTNAGDVIHNVTQFAMAGLVMRYGYMMEETIETYHTEWGNGRFIGNIGTPTNPKFVPQYEGQGRRGKILVTKRRVPANPFGFGVGWEGLSPTQLAIIAAIGITRLL